MKNQTPTLSHFESRWLAEAIRLRELSSGTLDDGEAVRQARQQGGDMEQRLLTRAHHLGVREGMSEAIANWRPRTRLLLLALSLLALLSGFAAALAVLGDGGRPVNIVWALGSLLGVHLLMLALWLLGLWLSGREAGGMLGHLWLWLSSRLFADKVPIANALASLLGRAGLLHWWLGAVTHGLWLLLLTGALLGLLVALAVRQYGFIWETTILPGGFFVQFVLASGWLPAQLGFAIPDADTVHASGAVALSDEAVQRAWSSWLVGCVVVYGIVPRLLCWSLCLGLYRHGRRTLRLNPGLPGFAALVQRLAPASERIGITHPAPPALHHAHIDTPHAVAGHDAVLLGLELRADPAWPPTLPLHVQDAGVIESREQRRHILTQLADTPPARLLIACDPRLSPDRGSLEFIATLSRHAGACRVWLRQVDDDIDPERRMHWHESLEAIGLTANGVIEDTATALSWLGGEHE